MEDAPQQTFGVQSILVMRLLMRDQAEIALCAPQCVCKSISSMVRLLTMADIEL